MTSGVAGRRRTSLVTGGTGGIGRAVAVRLAAVGDRVLITGRDPRRAAQALAEIKAVNPDAAHAFLPADLALLSETAELAETVRTVTEQRLDALVCCAGVLSLVPAYTSEGLERTLVLNYLSRYLLARRLGDLLRASPSGRLVLVANAGRYSDTLNFADLQHRHGGRGLAVAGRTQFANDLLAMELSQRWHGTGVQVTCVYPGVVRTEVFANATGVGPITRTVAVALSRLIGATPHDAADTPAFLASSPDAADLGGRFFGPRRRELPIPPRVTRLDRRAALWDASAHLASEYLNHTPHRSGVDDPTA